MRYRGAKVILEAKPLRESPWENWDSRHTVYIDPKIYWLSRTTVDKILKLASERIEANPKLRYGQVVWNALFTLRPSIAKQIRLTELDMYYYDDTALRTLMLLMRKDEGI